MPDHAEPARKAAEAGDDARVLAERAAPGNGGRYDARLNGRAEGDFLRGHARALNARPAVAAQRKAAEALARPNRTAPPRTGPAASGGPVLQLIYLRDGANGQPPVWSDEAEPPEPADAASPFYLASGTHDDGEHGQDRLFATLNHHRDWFYGLWHENNAAYDGFLASLQTIAERDGLNIDESPSDFATALARFQAEEAADPILSPLIMSALYGGGDATYQPFIQPQPEGANPNDNQQWAAGLRALNPDLPWAQDAVGFPCQVAMIKALHLGGSVRFLLDGMDDVGGVIQGISRPENITSAELRFAHAILGQDIAIGGEEHVRPEDGVNMFFYRARQLVPADQLLDANGALQAAGGDGAAEGGGDGAAAGGAEAAQGQAGEGGQQDAVLAV